VAAKKITWTSSVFICQGPSGAEILIFKLDLSTNISAQELKNRFLGSGARANRNTQKFIRFFF